MYNKQSNNKGSKNAFEVRLEVLKMAQDMMNQSYNDAQNLAMSMVEKSAEYQNKAVADMQEYYEKLKPEMYSPEDVVEKANELYEFVTNTETKSKDK